MSSQILQHLFQFDLSSHFAVIEFPKFKSLHVVNHSFEAFLAYKFSNIVAIMYNLPKYTYQKRKMPNFFSGNLSSKTIKIGDDVS